MTGLGKVLIAFGGMIILIGLIITLAGRAHLPLGRLPGDIVYRGKNTTFYVPLTTGIILSIVFSLITWIVGRFSR